MVLFEVRPPRCCHSFERFRRDHLETVWNWTGTIIQTWNQNVELQNKLSLPLESDSNIICLFTMKTFRVAYEMFLEAFGKLLTEWDTAISWSDPNTFVLQHLDGFIFQFFSVTTWRTHRMQTATLIICGLYLLNLHTTMFSNHLKNWY